MISRFDYQKNMEEAAVQEHIGDHTPQLEVSPGELRDQGSVVVAVVLKGKAQEHGQSFGTKDGNVGDQKPADRSGKALTHDEIP